jgi:hypothetical protein
VRHELQLGVGVDVLDTLREFGNLSGAVRDAADDAVTPGDPLGPAERVP